MTLFLRSGYSRIPVIVDTTDQVRGILYLKDVAARIHGRADHGAGMLVDQICREVRYVPESKAVRELLKEIQRESTHVAIVIDEYGGTAGLVTLEDLIEEIVGEIVDEYDTERPEIEALPAGRFRVSARPGVDDVGELFDIELDDDEVDTVGGLLAKHLGRVPIVGSEVAAGGPASARGTAGGAAQPRQPRHGLMTRRPRRSPLTTTALTPPTPPACPGQRGNDDRDHARFCKAHGDAVQRLAG